MNTGMTHGINIWTLLPGLILILLGVTGAHDLCVDRENRFIPVAREFLFTSPALFAVGCALFLRGLGYLAKPTFCRILMWTGIAILAPWGWFWFHEGAGIVVLFMFITVGLPGLVLTILGLGLRADSREKKDKHDA